ncbi:MAG TPA: hypothetical protein VD930_06840 [Gemmatimonadales bacterium]|nr:hypothetical protein [Gemmatimonadales bacterium]
MQQRSLAPAGRRGITVLALLLIIIAVVLVAFFLVSYLRTRPAPVQSSFALPGALTASGA